MPNQALESHGHVLVNEHLVKKAVTSSKVATVEIVGRYGKVWERSVTSEESLAAWSGDKPVDVCRFGCTSLARVTLIVIRAISCMQDYTRDMS